MQPHALKESFILNNFGGVQRNSLEHILQLDHGKEDYTEDSMTEDPTLIKMSPYYSFDGFVTMLEQEKNNFIILSINIQSIRAKYDNLSIL